RREVDRLVRRVAHGRLRDGRERQSGAHDRRSLRRRIGGLAARHDQLRREGIVETNWQERRRPPFGLVRPVVQEQAAPVTESAEDRLLTFLHAGDHSVWSTAALVVSLTR